MRAAAVEANIGRRLRRRREALSLSLGELSSRTGVPIARLQKWEAGRLHISAAILIMLANALAIDVDYFFEGLPPGAQPAPRAPGFGAI